MDEEASTLETGMGLADKDLEPVLSGKLCSVELQPVFPG
jgi:hypothetical protein